MSDTSLNKCPRCGDAFKAGFAVRSAGFSFVDPGKFESFAFIDEDISKAGLRKLVPWKAEYYRSYLCRSCKLYVVDYSEIYSRKQANEAAKSLSQP